MAKSESKPGRLGPARPRPYDNSPEYVRSRTLVGRRFLNLHDGDADAEELRSIGSKLFGAINERADLILTPGAPISERRRALVGLRKALTHLTPRGRPPHLTAMDLAHDASVIQRLHAEFTALMQLLAVAATPDSDSAREAVEYIRSAQNEYQDARADVARVAPGFLDAVARFSPKDIEAVLTALAKAQRPSRSVQSLEAFAALVISVKYRINRRTARTAVKAMRWVGSR